MNTTGSDLRLQRQKLGLSQAKLAEIAGVPQHILSAFELEKAAMPAPLLKCVSDALSDKMAVASIVSREKRYRKHDYSEVKKLPARIKLATRTDGNFDYLLQLDDLAKAHTKNSNKRLNALSLFSGCGGFSLGFSTAGFSVKGFLELDDDLREIYKLNFPNAVEIGSDITKVTKQSLEYFSNTLGNIDVIIGGPPCQGFSLSGKRDVEDPRNLLFKHYLRFVDAFKPKFAVLENVRLLTSMKNKSGGFVRDDICREFIKHGYKIQCFDVNAKFFGVPQHRERVIFVAVRNDLPHLPSLPRQSHFETKEASLFGSFSPFRTFADACSDLPFLESGEKSDCPLHEAVKHPSHVIDWLWDVAQGYSAHDNIDKKKRPLSGYNTTYKRQIWNEPASTVQTTFGMISGCRNVHPIATRSLTIREAARIQSFPDSFLFAGSLGVIRRGIGNAVPPLLAHTIALHLKKMV